MGRVLEQFMSEVRAELASIKKAVGERQSEPLAVTMEEAARLLSISTKSVQRMVKDGRLRSVRYGQNRRRLVSMDALRSLLAPKETPPRAAPVRRRRSASGDESAKILEALKRRQ